MLEMLKAALSTRQVLVQGVGVETDANIIQKPRYVNRVIRENRFTPSKCLGVAIHMNSSLSNKPRGFEVWYQKAVPKSSLLATDIVNAWSEKGLLPLRPRPLNKTSWHRYGRLYIDDYLCPFILVEVGFMSNLGDLTVIQRDAEKIARVLVDGILNYINKT